MKNSNLLKVFIGVFVFISLSFTNPNSFPSARWEVDIINVHVTFTPTPNTTVNSGDYYYATLSGHPFVIIDLQSPSGSPVGTWTSSNGVFTFSPALTIAVSEGDWNMTSNANHSVIGMKLD